LVLIFVLRPLMMGKEGKYIPAMLGIMTLLAVAYLCFVQLYPFPADVDAHNLASGRENAYTLLGCLLGLILVYTVDEKWLQFPVEALWWAQILKVIGGFAAVMVVKSGMKGMLNSLFGEAFGRGIRYFLIVIVAGILWPLTFKWFSRLGRKE